MSNMFRFLMLIFVCVLVVSAEQLPVQNTSATDTVYVGRWVGFPTAPITVVAKTRIGNTTAAVPVSDSLLKLSMIGGDTLRRLPGHNITRFDTSKIVGWTLRVKFYQSAATNDTLGFRIVGRTRSSMSRQVFEYKGKRSSAIDTIVPLIFGRVESVVGRGRHANDSIAVFAYPFINVGVRPTNDSTLFGGIALTTIPPRKRGVVAFTGDVVEISPRNEVLHDSMLGGYIIPVSGGSFTAVRYNVSAVRHLAIGRLVSFNPLTKRARIVMHNFYALPDTGE